MRITFLLGNGFDIGLGLKTRYTDFYKEYTIEQENDSDNIKQFKALIRGNGTPFSPIIDWSDFESAFGKHSENFDESTKRDYITQFEDFLVSFNTYLQKEEEKVSYENEELIVQTMKKALSEFYHIRATDKASIESTIRNSNSISSYGFISFNYTQCVDNCVKILLKSEKDSPNKKKYYLAHIHGYVDANMIMGVNDPSQIANPSLSTDEEVLSEIVKPRQNEDAREGYENQVNSIISDSTIICVYGMSIGSTDAKWWDILSHWLAKSITNQLVILTYDPNYDKRFVHTQRRITNEVIDRFLSFSSLSDTGKKAIKPHIFVGINHNVFAMDLCKKNLWKNKDIVVLDEKKQTILF